eukprot:13451032-Heterocapsa_arctica.AAC.1
MPSGPKVENEQRKSAHVHPWWKPLDRTRRAAAQFRAWAIGRSDVWLAPRRRPDSTSGRAVLAQSCATH